MEHSHGKTFWLEQCNSGRIKDGDELPFKTFFVKPSIPAIPKNTIRLYLQKEQPQFSHMLKALGELLNHKDLQLFHNQNPIDPDARTPIEFPSGTSFSLAVEGTDGKTLPKQGPQAMLWQCGKCEDSYSHADFLRQHVMNRDHDWDPFKTPLHWISQVSNITSKKEILVLTHLFVCSTLNQVKTSTP